MKLMRLETIPAKDALRNTVAMLASCGYESRSRAITSLLGSGLREKMALSFLEHRNAPEREKNDYSFRRSGFRLELISGGNGSAAGLAMSTLVDRVLCTGGELTVDISTMTRIWYAAAIGHLRARTSDCSLVVNFLYFPGRYKSNFLQGAPNEVVGPVPGFCSLDAPEQPTALVLGLGFDDERARGLQELLEPKKTVFLKVGRGFRPLIDIPEGLRGPTLGDAWRDAIEYPLRDPLTTFQLTESITRGLSTEHRVVLVSLGPKMLGLLFLLVGVQEPGVSVWRVSSGTSQLPTDTEAEEEAVVCRTVWG
jgi:hypothetical protein